MALGMLHSTTSSGGQWCGGGDNIEAERDGAPPRTVGRRRLLGQEPAQGRRSRSSQPEAEARQRLTGQTITMSSSAGTMLQRLPQELGSARSRSWGTAKRQLGIVQRRSWRRLLNNKIIN
jgi:hypothetical protein